ncbi:bacterial alpha-L-rhamnosidase domain-containing protein [Cryomyces antarcticus]
MMKFSSSIPSALTVVGALIGGTLAAQYEQYILAPSSRTLHPVSVYKVNGTVSNAQSLTGNKLGSAIFQDASAVTYDYGKNIAGVVSLTIGENLDVNQYVGITFSESSLWISGLGSDATADSGIDETLWFQPSAPGVYTVSREHERGGFKYLSLIHNTTGKLEVTQVTTHFTPMPHYTEYQLRNYTGYFHCNDDLINRIWYAGAYTNQMCTIEPTHGNALVHLFVVNSTTPGNMTAPLTWYNNYTVTNGSSCLVDGAKRDRLAWAGDMSIAVPGIVVSTNDLISVRNSLDSLFLHQNKTTGQLPYAGVPFPSIYSATYHLYTLIGVADYYQYSNDLKYLSGIWDQWKFGMNFSLSFIDNSGMMNVTSAADWLRFGMGGHNIEANSILYYTVNQGINLASVVNDTSVISAWTACASRIKSAANSLLWNETAGLFHDNETTTLMPQDGNSWAVVSNITANSSQNTAISANLANRWTPFGAPAVEADNAVSPFISGFELQAHLLAGNASAALALMRLEWGFMLNDPRMTNSTFIEGYQDDGVLHYAPYTNDPRISHAHGWATGPTSTLTFYIAGIQLLSAGGQTWKMAPALGDLTSVDAGFATSLGMFAAQTNVTASGGMRMSFEAPVGTMGAVSVPYPSCSGKMLLHEVNGASGDLEVDVVAEKGTPTGNIEIDGLEGGQWELDFSCS